MDKIKGLTILIFILLISITSAVALSGTSKITIITGGNEVDIKDINNNINTFECNTSETRTLYYPAECSTNGLNLSCNCPEQVCANITIPESDCSPSYNLTCEKQECVCQECPQNSDTPLWAIIIILLVVCLGLFVFIMIKPKEKPAIQQQPIPQQEPTEKRKWGNL